MLGDVGILMRATFIAQGIGLLALPILSRLYGPTDFGDFTLYQAALLILTVVICMRYDQAILTAPDDAEALALLQLCVIVAICVAALLAVPILLLDRAGYAAALSGPVSPVWLIVGGWVSGVVLAANATLTRLSAFEVTGRTKVGQSAGGTVAALTFGAMAPSGLGLIVADQMGKAVAIVITARHLASRIETLVRIDWGALGSLARKYAAFPRLSVLGGLLNNGGSFLTPVMLYALYGAEIAGQFALVDRTISLPLSLVILSVSQVFSAHYARLLREDPAQALLYFRSLIRTSAVLAVIPTVIGMLLAPTLFPLAFGARWAEAGWFAQLLAVMYFSAAVMGPVNAALVVANRLGWQLGWEAARLALLIGLWLTVTRLELDASSALIGFAAVTVIVNLAFVLLAYVQLLGAVAERRSSRG
ncbi:MAG: oligosaccharide flippase family protein [Sphingomonadaceae bacterium]